MSESVHPVDERLPTSKLTALGLQHVLVMYAGAVAVPLIVGAAVFDGRITDAKTITALFWAERELAGT